MQTPQFDARFWDDLYLTRDALWSGTPNAVLVAETLELPPGRALDVGCGEGADVLWLARRGWQVTGADISQVALDRAAAHVAEAAPEVDVRWERVDLLASPPHTDAYDLVSAHYFMLPPGPRGTAMRALAAAVAPGGILLVVGHHPSELDRALDRTPDPDLFALPEELAAELPGEGWEVVTCEGRTRQGIWHDGSTRTMEDAVLLARRQG